jgi:hypothetical protein
MSKTLVKEHFKQKWLWRIEMNVTISEEPYEIVAKTCGCKERNIKVTYSFVDDITVFVRTKKTLYCQKYKHVKD